MSLLILSDLRCFVDDFFTDYLSIVAIAVKGQFVSFGVLRKEVAFVILNGLIPKSDINGSLLIVMLLLFPSDSTANIFNNQFSCLFSQLVALRIFDIFALGDGDIVALLENISGGDACLSIPLRCNFENTCLCFDELPFGV
jgi:hypothetical protein